MEAPVGDVIKPQTTEGERDPDVKSDASKVSKEPDYPAATKTGFRELPVNCMLFMLIVGSMRFFIPWFAGWHEYNVFILVDPDDYKAAEKTILMNDVIIFGVTAGVALLSSILADVLEIKYVKIKYVIFLVFIFAYGFCPIAGGAADAVLRARHNDKKAYKLWVSSVILVRWAMAIPSMAFPVQFACMFSQRENMSRQAHYNWAALFILVESINAFIAFWAMPAKCPTAVLTQNFVWTVMAVLLYLVIAGTIIFFFLTHLNVAYCKKICGKINALLTPIVPKMNFNQPAIPPRLKIFKMTVVILMLLPAVFAAFVFAAMQRILPDEDWEKHRFLSATSLFFFGKILGIILMVLFMFSMRMVLGRMKIPTWKSDLWRIPHLILVLSLIVLVSRFGTLSQLKDGEAIIGPIPDAEMSVLEVYNIEYKRRTVCVRTDTGAFQPFKVRAFQRGTTELYGLSEGANISIKVCVDPSSTPTVYTESHFIFRKGWTAFIVYLRIDFDERSASTQKLTVVHRTGAEFIVPQELPTVIFMNTFVTNSTGWLYYTKWIDDDVPNRVEMNPPPMNSFQYYNRPGILGVRNTLDYVHYAGNEEIVAKETVFTTVKLERFSLYSLILCHIRTNKTGAISSFTPTFMPFLMAQIAGPDNITLPTKSELQHDWAIKLAMTLAGMSSSGIYLGYIYIFWIDSPYPNFRTTSLAIFWVFVLGAELAPKIKAVDIGVRVSSLMLAVQLILYVMHVYGAAHVYSPKCNMRQRSD